MAGWKGCLVTKGNRAKLRDLDSRLHVVAVKQHKLCGASDPRRKEIGLGKFFEAIK